MIMRWLGTADDINVWQCPKCKDVRIEGKSGLGGSAPECGCDADDRVYLGRDEDSFYIRIPKCTGSTSDGGHDEPADKIIAPFPDSTLSESQYPCRKCSKVHDSNEVCV